MNLSLPFLSQYLGLLTDREGKNGGGKGHGGDGNLLFVKKDYLIKKVELLHEIKSIS